MQAASVDLDAQQLLEPNIGKLNVPAKMIEESELTRFVGRLERGRTKPKSLNEALGECPVEISVSVEHAYSPYAYPVVSADHNRLY
jgi:hypothetical protein